MKVFQIMFIRVIIIVFFLSFLQGCATTARYEATLNKWLGRNINELVQQIGYPLQTMQAPNGNTVYVYAAENSYTNPTTYETTFNTTWYGDVTATTNAHGGDTVSYWCMTYLEVDANNIIVNWRWQGNHCVQ